VRLRAASIGWWLAVWTSTAAVAATPPSAGQAPTVGAKTGEVRSDAFRNSPMTITSERLTIHDAERRATFEGSVVAKQGDLILRADRVDVWTVDSPSATSGAVYGGNNISVIKASGHVEVTQEDRMVLADQAVYTQATQQIEMTGNLSGHEGSGYKISGTSMVIYLLEHRSVIQQSHVEIPPAALSTMPDGAGPQQP